jgi:uncharacterized protein
LNERDIIQKTTDHVRGLLSGEGSGHDWFHIERVRNTALAIARQEHADLFVVELAALLHDVADWKFAGGDHDAGPRAAHEWLASLDVAPRVIDHVCGIIAGLSFKGAGVETPMNTIEGQCVQDADRLDAVGAIGIARAFAFAGAHSSRLWHEPWTSAPPDEAKPTGANYTPVHEFVYKLSRIAGTLHTATAQAIAAERHRFMCTYFDRLDAEMLGLA